MSNLLVFHAASAGCGRSYHPARFGMRQVLRSQIAFVFAGSLRTGRFRLDAADDTGQQSGTQALFSIRDDDGDDLIGCCR